MVTRIAGESEENCLLREQLNKKLHILTKGIETCKRFVGVRNFGRRKPSNSILYLLTWLAETSDMRAHTQNKPPASSVSSQEAPENIEEPQDDDVVSGPSSPVESQGNGFESATRPQSSLVEEEDKYINPELITTSEEKEHDVAPTWTGRRRHKKGSKKPPSTAYAL